MDTVKAITLMLLKTDKNKNNLRHTDMVMSDVSMKWDFGS